MQWLLLIAGVVSSWFVVNAARPLKGRWSVAPGFFASWLTIELAFHWLALNLVIIVVAFEGASSWWGLLGLLLLAQSSVGLLKLGYQGLQAREQMQEALAALPAPLSPDSKANIRFPWLHVVFPPMMQRRAGVRRVRNLEFARVGGRILRLDLTLPADTQPGETRPVVLQIHGGAWVIGNKRDQGQPLMNHLAAQGWVCVNANYRLSPGATFPDHLVDCKRALAWIRGHIADFGGDPDYVCVTGGSAGGHLAAMMALTANESRYQPGFEEVDTSVEAAVPMYGCYDFTNRLGTYPASLVERILQPLVMKAFLDEEPERFAEASPIDQVHPDAPPFLVLHGDRDTLIPLPDTRLFVERLREVSHQRVFYAELRGAQHGFELFPSPRAARVIEGVGRFLTILWERRAEGPLELPAGDAKPGETPDEVPEYDARSA